MEVQTYQQQVLIDKEKQRLDDLAQLRTDMERMLTQVGRHQLKLEAIEQGREVDLTALKELGRDSPILLQILQEIKADVLDVCAHKEQIKGLSERLEVVE